MNEVLRNRTIHKCRWVVAARVHHRCKGIRIVNGKFINRRTGWYYTLKSTSPVATAGQAMVFTPGTLQISVAARPLGFVAASGKRLAHPRVAALALPLPDRSSRPSWLHWKAPHAAAAGQPPTPQPPTTPRTACILPQTGARGRICSREQLIARERSRWRGDWGRGATRKNAG